MTRDVETLPSGKLIVQRFGDDGQLVEESHSYGGLEIGCTMSFENGAKTQELYFVKKRLVGRTRYQKARVEYPDMPPADESLADSSGELTRLARRDQRQRAAAVKRWTAKPLTEKQELDLSRQMELFQAVGDDELETLRQLLDGGADPNWVAVGRGHTPLYNAYFVDSVAAVRLLIQYGADPNLKFEYHSPMDGRVETDLVALMFAGSLDVAKVLMDAGAAVNVRDGDGVTPLMRAARRGAPDVVRMFLQAGASAESRSNSGQSASDLAADKSEFFVEHAARFKEGHVDRRIAAYREACRLLAAGDA